MLRIYPVSFATNMRVFNTYFFECVVAQQMWAVISECIDIPVPSSFYSLLSFWKRKKHCDAVTSAALWNLWLL